MSFRYKVEGVDPMFAIRSTKSTLFVCLFILATCVAVSGRAVVQDEEFGPVVRAYLGYLRNEQEVVDDRANRREVTVAYYKRNSNRIRALRQMAIHIARQSGNDYLPELEAVASDELRSLFQRPPVVKNLRVGEVIQATFRYLGPVRAGDTFYVFARLDPYEQAELLEKSRRTSETVNGSIPADPLPGAKVNTRARRVLAPRL